MTEEWRPVANWPGYEVSSIGRVRSERRRPEGEWRILKPFKAPYGYVMVALYRDSFMQKFCVHQLVARAFLGPKPSDKHLVAHADNDPKNNHVENLRWATQQENMRDKVRHGTAQRGERHPRSKFSDETARLIRRRGLDGESCTDMASEYGVHPTTIHKIVVGKNYIYLDAPDAR